jgi:alkylation response protein AidB-like acyl-CoA dehydrogenase
VQHIIDIGRNEDTARRLAEIISSSSRDFVEHWAPYCHTAARSRKRRYLPKIAAAELRLQAFGVTEPTTGSDTTKLKTRAVKQGNHYVINGQKVWT